MSLILFFLPGITGILLFEKFIEVNKALIKEPDLNFQSIEDVPGDGIMEDLSGLNDFLNIKKFFCNIKQEQYFLVE